MNGQSTKKLTDEEAIEALKAEIALSDEHAQRLADLVDELGQLFDELEQANKDQMPGWWEANDPIAKIRAELDGWLPARVWREARAQGKVTRGKYAKENR